MSVCERLAIVRAGFPPVCIAVGGLPAAHVAPLSPHQLGPPWGVRDGQEAVRLACERTASFDRSTALGFALSSLGIAFFSWNIITCGCAAPNHTAMLGKALIRSRLHIPGMSHFDSRKNMPASTPMARTKSAALSRVVDSVPKGYTRYMSGTVAAAKAAALARKFHQLYGIGCSPAQRLTRKRAGRANCLLVLYWPPDAEDVHWLLLATPGSGLEAESRNLRDVTANKRLVWLGYELVMRPERGRPAWTWRRTKQEMTDLYNLLQSQLSGRHYNAVAQTLTRIAHQPGFHGVREQSWELCQFAYKHGYPGELPKLFFMQKISHGEPLLL